MWVYIPAGKELFDRLNELCLTCEKMELGELGTECICCSIEVFMVMGYRWWSSGLLHYVVFWLKMEAVLQQP
jgi:hypothetical protein